MQLTIKLKGWLRILLFSFIVLVVVPFLAYKTFRHVLYWKTMHDLHKKQVRKRSLHYQFTLVDTADKGYILMVPNSTLGWRYFSWIMIADLKGKILLSKPVYGWASDFRKWTINGHTRYSYSVDYYKDQGIPKGSGGYVVIADSAFNELKQFHLLSHDDITGDKQHGYDGHDFILLSDDHYIALASYKKKVTNIPLCLMPAKNSMVTACIIQEVDHGKVIWQWDASRYPEFYLSSVAGNSFSDTVAQDYMHVNAMAIDPNDSNLIISIPRANQIVKVNRHNGDVMWRLGGRNSDFPLTPDETFFFQHDITFTDSNKTLLMLDNGVPTSRNASRVLEMRIDEKNKKLASFKAYQIPEPLSAMQGSVQKVNGDYFICGGSSAYLLLIDPGTGKKKLEMKCNQILYRAYLVDDITGIVPYKIMNMENLLNVQ